MMKIFAALNAMDTWVIVKTFWLCNHLQNLTGIISFQVGRWFSMMAAVYWGIASIGWMLPEAVGIQAIVWLAPLTLILTAMEIHDADRYAEATVAWNAMNPDDGIPPPVAKLIIPAYSPMAVIFRVSFVPVMSFFWFVVLYNDIRKGWGIGFLHDALYIPWMLNRYIQCVIPKPTGKSKVREFLESLGTKLIPIEVKE